MNGLVWGKAPARAGMSVLFIGQVDPHVTGDPGNMGELIL